MFDPMITLTIKSKTYGVHNVYYDDAFSDLVEKFIWCIVPNRKTFYAMSRIKLSYKKYKTIRMHQLFVLSSQHIDHIDGNGLNNTLMNLRPATTQQNNFNVGLTSRNKTGYKGVYRQRNSFIACIRVSRKLIHGGSFKTAVDAAKRYNELAIEHHKEFAWLNPV